MNSLSAPKNKDYGTTTDEQKATESLQTQQKTYKGERETQAHRNNDRTTQQRHRLGPRTDDTNRLKVNSIIAS
jgi:hypothetical protein